MLRFVSAALALTLAACAPPVPDSGAGVGFQNYNDYNSYRVARENELRAESPSPVTPIAGPNISDETPITTATLTAAGIGPRSAVPASAPANPAPTSPTVVAAAPAPDPVQGRVVAVPENEPTISDEQNFAAVSDRQTIESDAARLRAQRQAYQVVQPTAVPQRTGTEGPNIVQFALSTRNAVGQKVYSRSALQRGARYQRNCANYASADLAQEDFLRSGGPERDKLGIDPDGDGFACNWDPTPFRRVSRSGG